MTNRPTLSKHARAHAPAASAERNQVIALARGLAILRCFTKTRRELGSTELARLTGFPQPTVWRLCQTLVQAGFLATAPDSQRFRLGCSVLELGFTASATFDILEEVRPRMQQLADAYRAEITIAGREALDMVYLERCSADVMAGMNFSRESVVRTAHGWAYMAAINATAREALLARVRRAEPERWPDVERELGAVMRDYQRKGFVLRRGLSHPDIVSLAVPIVSTTDAQVLAICCSSHRRELSAARFESEVAPQLKELAGLIGSALTHPLHDRIAIAFRARLALEGR